MTAIPITFLLIQLLTARTADSGAVQSSTDLTGWLNTVWADWGDGQSAQFFYLVEADGTRTRLLLDESLAPWIPGFAVMRKVKVKGFWREDVAGRILKATDLQAKRSFSPSSVPDRDCLRA